MPWRETITHGRATARRRFDWFRHRYNAVRPHEALADATPASCYRSPGEQPGESRRRVRRQGVDLRYPR